MEAIRHCWPWQHTWTRWVPDFPGAWCQKRTCTRCGKAQGRCA